MTNPLQEVIILIICFSASFDYLIGEPPNRVHPVVWIGKTINFFANQIKKKETAKYLMGEMKKFMDPFWQYL